MNKQEFEDYLQAAAEKVKTVKNNGKLFGKLQQKLFLDIYTEIFNQVQYDVEQNEAAQLDLTMDDIDLIAWNCTFRLM